MRYNAYICMPYMDTIFIYLCMNVHTQKKVDCIEVEFFTKFKFSFLLTN